MSEDRKKKILSISLRTLILYAVFVCLSCICSALFILGSGYLLEQLNLPREPVLALSTVSILFCLYSLTRAFELYDLDARGEFLGFIGEKYSLHKDLKLPLRELYLSSFLFRSVLYFYLR